MIQLNIQFLPSGMAVFTHHLEQVQTEQDFMCTSTISKEHARFLIKFYGMVKVNEFYYNTPIHWQPSKEPIQKESGSGKILNENYQQIEMVLIDSSL